jgi:hypothetical protein
VLQADQDSSTTHDLAARTVAHLKSRDSPEENVASGTISYDRDEVSGPLRSAPGVNGIVDIDDTYEEEIKEQEGAWTHKVKREVLEREKVRRLAFSIVVRVVMLRCITDPSFLSPALKIAAGLRASQSISSDRVFVTPESAVHVS